MSRRLSRVDGLLETEDIIYSGTNLKAEFSQLCSTAVSQECRKCILNRSSKQVNTKGKKPIVEDIGRKMN